VCLALLAAAAFGRVRWRIPYELWRRSHAVLAAAIVAALLVLGAVLFALARST
jgi:hypothetical protein